MKPKCFTCKHRGMIPGDAHICCKHPQREGIEVAGNPTGIRRGWFNHPWNFDPNFLISCSGYVEAEPPKGIGT